MHYTLHQLEIFYTISETKSITKAAELLHLTQPAVSIQLKNFQDQFDIPLSEIIGRSIYITDFGKEIAKMCEQIIHQTQAINYKTQSYKGLVSGKLRIAVVSTGKYVMPYFCSHFINQYPEVELIMDVTNKSKVVESIEQNLVDFALVSILPQKLDVNQIDLLRNNLYFVGPKNAKYKKIDAPQKTMKELTLLYREVGSGTRFSMEKYIHRYKIDARKKNELTSNEAVKQAIMAGMGYSIMPLIGLRNELKNRELKIIPCKGLPIKTTWSLIWLKQKKLSPAAEAFKNVILAQKQNIKDTYFAWHETY